MLAKKDKVLIVLFAIIGSISQPLIAYTYIMLGNFIDVLNNNELYKMILMMLISFLGIGAYYFGMSYIRNRLALNLKNRIFNKIINRDLRDLKEKDFSEYINMLNIRVDTWKDMYFSSIMAIIKDVLQIVFMVGFLFVISYKVTFVVILLTIPLVLNNILFPRYIDKNINKYFDSQDMQLYYLKDIFSGIDVIKNCGCEDKMELKSKDVFYKLYKNIQKIENLENASGFLANSGVAISQISGLALSSYLLSKKQISLGEFMAMLQLTFFLNEPFIALVNNVIKMTGTKGLDKAIRTILEEEKNKDNLDGKRCTNEGCNLLEKNTGCDLIRRIDLKDLSFAYDTKKILNGVNYSFEENKKYLIKGRSGSGKSTLIKLIMKLEDKTSGDILINNKSIDDVSNKYIQSNIAYLNQEPYVFNLSLRENIDINNKLDDKSLLEVIDKVNYVKLYNELGSLDSVIDSVNRNISGGEKARIALARILVLDKKVIITDEILANLDKKNSELIERILLDLEDKTVINICHHHNEELENRYEGVLLL